MLRHVVQFRWKDDVTEEEKLKARDTARAMLGVVPTLRAISVGIDIQRNPNNWGMAMIADFDDRAGLEAYFKHPVMNATSDHIATVTQTEVTARVQFMD